MSIGFYFDEQMPRSAAKGLAERGFQVVMAVDEDMVGKDDDTEHLPFASEQGLVIVTFDRPFAGHTASRTDHAGLICLSENLRMDIGGIIRVLSAYAEQHSNADVSGQVFWLK
jgi:predicted nuclease of predicted toxin-antitoxin system